MAWSKRPRSSGVRNVASLLAGYSSSTFNVNLLRVGDGVEFVIFVRQFDVAEAGSGAVLLTLPTGFRPAIAYRIYAVSPAGAQINVATNGVVSVVSGSIPLGTYVTLKLTHLTTEAMPASFPGS